MKFVTMAGRAKHLGTSIICKRWWEMYLDDLRETSLQLTPDKSSSEVGSDDEGTFPLDGCEVPMDLDEELGNEILDDELTERLSTEDVEFTASPSGIDLRSAGLLIGAESLVSVEEYPEAAQIIDESKDLYSQIWEGDKLYESRKIGGPFYPFSGFMEWEVVEWLHSLDVPMERIDRFFKLDYVRSWLTKWTRTLTHFTHWKVKRRPFSFTSAQEMRTRIENLPSPPRWKEVEVSVEGGITKDALTLYYRDGLECFRFLFGNPLFLDHMEYVPRREYTTGEKVERLYNEMMTGDRAWDLQVNTI